MKDSITSHLRPRVDRHPTDTRRTSLILAYQPLVNRIANQYAPLLASIPTSALTLDDLIQEGNLGLITAIDRGKAPMPFVIKFVLEAIRCHANILTRPFHNHAPLISVPSNQVLYREDDDAITLADTLPDTVSGLLQTSEDDYITPLTVLQTNEQNHRLQEAFAALTPREQSILNDFYGLNAPTRSSEQIAQDCGLSHDRVKKIRQKAIKKLFRATRF